MTIPRKPMVANEQHGAETRWLQKQVLNSVLLDDAENPANWIHVEQGAMEFTKERCKVGTQSIRLTSPTLSDKSFQNEGPGRPHGRAAVQCLINDEDWREFNRISFWVYPTLPGFRVISMSVILYNDGETKVPDAYLREGIHYFLLKPNEWNQLVWEIDSLARDKVTGLEFVYRLQGSDVGATKTVCYDIDLIELQTVEADRFEGWTIPEGEISYSHTGYSPEASKVAIGNGIVAEKFHIWDSASEKVIFTSSIKTIQTPLGKYQELDFSELHNEGTYWLEAADVKTQSFQIAKNIWRETIWKTLNLFYCERCGTEVPGIHGVCHRDWLTEHEGKQIVINGGWHDAGDLSQGLVNTSEAVYAMLSLAEALEDKDPELALRLGEEAMWGLEWVLKTRFGDGYRTTWATMDIWTDGILGTFDDEVNQANNNPYENLIAAATEALAARLLRTEDSLLAEHCLQAAIADFQLAYLQIKDWTLALAAQAVLAAVELFKAGAGESYASHAVKAAATILACQQKSIPDWEIPLCGFYYTTPEKKQILHYDHRGHEQAPTVALVALCELFREHEQWINWYAAIVWHSEYLRSAAACNAPYYMISAGIYHLDESKKDNFQEQVRHGIALGAGYYLRRFSVWFAFRGNSGTVLAQTKAITAAASLRNNQALYDLSQLQLEWTVGRNPFVQSLMYGEGYNYAPQYTAVSGNIVGSLPVGIQTNMNRDEPYWPMQNCYNYKEVWVMPSSRWLWLMEDVYQPANVQKTNKLHAEDKGRALKLFISVGALTEGQTTRIRTINLKVSAISSDSLNYFWDADILDSKEPWVAVLEISLTDGSLYSRSEVFGGFPILG